MDGRVTAGDLRLNERATRLADTLAADPDRFGVAVSTLAEGTRLIDCGVAAPGGLEAGRLLGEVCMGGLGHVAFTPLKVGESRLAGLHVRTDHPAASCMASQYAGWAIQPEGFFGMGSGPLRAIARVEKELFDRLGVIEPADGSGVLVLEGRTPPDDAVARHIADKAGIAPDRLTILIAPTASLAGTVQISARVVETCLHKLGELGFDVRQVASGFGSAPVAPVAKSDLRAIGRTNDCILYGGVVQLTVRAEDEELERLAPEVPSSASRDYGTPFYETFQRYDGDFYKVDPHLFSPAEVYLTSAESGRTFQAGRINAGVLRRSLLD